MSFPPGTEMFQFPGFAFIPLFYSENKYLLLISVGPKTASGVSHRNDPCRPIGTQTSALCGFHFKFPCASSEQQRSKVGFPIRRFTDQSLFAAPHDLSQRTTSFIASQRQGIHQIPLRHLIALIAKARFGGRRTDHREQRTCVLRCLSSDVPIPNAFGVEKTSFASNASGDLSGQAPNPRLVLNGGQKDGEQRTDKIRPPISVVRLPVTECASSSQCQIIGRTRSDDGERIVPSPAFRPSLRPGAFGAPAKLIKLHRKDQIKTTVVDRSPSVLRRPTSVIRNGGARRDRTDDLMLAKHALSQLSYGPVGGLKTEDGEQINPTSVVRCPSSDNGGPGRT